MNDPLFLHEYIEKEKASELRYFESKMKTLTDRLSRQVSYDLVREIVIELGYLDYEVNLAIYDWGGYHLDLSLLKHDTITDGMTKIMDVCDLVLSGSNYALDTDDTRQAGSHYSVVYSNKDYREKITLEVYIATSDKCKQVKTHKMQEVTEYVCDE